MRKSITFLQSTAKLYGKTITRQTVDEITGVIREEVINDFLEHCEKHGIDDIQACVNDIVANGYPAGQVLERIHDRVVSQQSYSDLQKAKILLHVARANKALLDGCSETLQLMDVGCTVMACLHDPSLPPVSSV
eukprot:c2801_g1_i2.p1 GENE.c2801_g1_i2~~c2801_g1_i2.p1  ORF type:complete len:134 (+),score=31.56 c2801_g1_i2:2-403(+)